MLSVVALGWLILAWWWWSRHRSKPQDLHRRFAKQLHAMPASTPVRRGSRAASHRVRRARRQQRATLFLLALVFLSAIIGLLSRDGLLGGILVTAALAVLGAYRIAARRATDLAARRQRATSTPPRSRPLSGPPRR